MQQSSASFTYNAERGDFAGTMVPLLASALLECVLCGILIAFLVPGLVLKLMLLAALTILIGFATCAVLSPLWTRHTLSPTHLHLHFGLLFNVDLPRTLILRVRPVEHDEIVGTQGARYDRNKGRVIVVFSKRGQVVVELGQPERFRVGLFSSGPADSILINVDHRDELLAALAVSADQAHAFGRGDTGPKRQAPVDEHRSMWPARPGTVLPRNVASAAPIIEREAPAIQASGLVGSYAGVTVVSDLNLLIRSGEVYGFLGPNGAGKTTTIKMMVGLLEPRAGHIAIAGNDVWTAPLQAKASFGYVADRAILYDRLTGREFLEFMAQIRRMPRGQAKDRIDRLLALLDMTQHAGRTCESYSLGMKRKIALAGALLHEPRALILDEPLSGLDPRSANRLRNFFGELAAGGTTIFLSTHDLATAEAICHRVGIIHQGHLVAEGSAAELRALAGGGALEAAFLKLTEDDAQVVP